MPNWFWNVTHLVKLILFQSQLKEGGTTEILAALPNLMLLHLSRKSYTGEKLVFGAKEFPNLRRLDIQGLKQLREVRFEEGASPHMERIEMEYCRLHSGIIGIKHLPRLKEISLNYRGQVAKLAMLQEEVDAHSNHPVLRMMDDRSKHDLGDVEGSTVAVEAQLTMTCSPFLCPSGVRASSPRLAPAQIPPKKKIQDMSPEENLTWCQPRTSWSMA